MYETFFQLSRRPFASAPRCDQFYPARAIEAARQTLSRCVQRAEGAGLLVGPSGTGKTLVCRLLADEFRPRFAVAQLGSGRLSTRRALLQAILFELGVPYRGLAEGELRLALLDRLANLQQCPHGMLLLVDEAHTMPLRLLEEVRLITNVVLDGQPRVRLVLAGSRVLEERLANPKLESFSQRIAARCYLESLDRDETIGYVRAQLQTAGGGEIFAEDGLSAVYHATDGVPRLINQVCDHALLLACAGGQRSISAAGVEEAWADLQQLPTPFGEPASDTAVRADVIEFGRLDDDATPPHASTPALRLAAEADDRQPDPEKWLDQVEDQLSSLDDDFEPAGTIGPELELSFPQSPDPFAEHFDEEEVVLDRCGLSGAPAWSGSPLVSCREGRMLSALMAPYVGMRAPAPWKPRPADTPIGWDAASHELASRVSTAPRDADALDESRFPQPARNARTREIPADSAMVARPLDVDSALASARATDRAVMVVEDDPRHDPTHRRANEAPARRSQFSHLFAGLRRA